MPANKSFWSNLNNMLLKCGPNNRQTGIGVKHDIGNLSFDIVLCRSLFWSQTHAQD